MDDRERITTNHHEIMEWVKERGGVPAFFLRDEKSDLAPKLKINFAIDEMDERSQEVTWELFFEELEDQNLAFKYRQLKKDGTSSTYCQFISR